MKKILQELLILDPSKQKYWYKPAGLSVYKNIIILFDEDFDTRVVIFIDQNLEKLQEIETVAVAEHEGHIIIYYANGNYFYNKTFKDKEVFEKLNINFEVENDFWSSEFSFTM